MKETDAYPKSMGYRIDTANVDKVKFPRHEVAQKCSECQLWSGKAGDPLGHLLVLQAPGASGGLVPQLQTEEGGGLSQRPMNTATRLGETMMTSFAGPMPLRQCGLRAAVLLAAALLLGACEQPQSDQRGPRGSSQIQLKKPSAVAALADINKIPAPEEPADVESPPTGEVFANVKVLNDISATEFSRLMQAFSTWVAPEEGCEFCHNTDKMESDEKYPKVVARRMIEMTRQLNTEVEDARRRNRCHLLDLPPRPGRAERRLVQRQGPDGDGGLPWQPRRPERAGAECRQARRCPAIRWRST